MPHPVLLNVGFNRFPPGAPAEPIDIIDAFLGAAFGHREVGLSGLVMPGDVLTINAVVMRRDVDGVVVHFI